MCKLIATLTLMLVFSMSLFGANVVPVPNLPQKPTKQLMSRLNNSADLFAEKIISYYAAAVCYEAQLGLMGVRPARELIAPTLEQLSRPHQRVLQTQWQQAAALYNQLAGLKITADNPQMEALRASVHELQEELSRVRLESASELSRTRAENSALQLEVTRLEIYPDLHEKALGIIALLRSQVNRHTIPTFGVSVGVTSLIFEGSGTTSNASADVGLVFNPTTLLGIGNFLDVWFNYSTPNIKTSGYEALIHNTNFLSTGVNVILPLSKILEIEKFYWNLKGGIGYYWIDKSTPNVYVDKELWKGVMLKAEMEFINLATRFPFGIYASATINSTMKTDPFPVSSSLNAGLRFYLTGSQK